MSDKGIFTALSGAVAQGQRLDTLANNIANANTAAFKKDQQVFKEYLTAQEKPLDVLNVPKVPASIESFYDVQGGDKGYVDSAGTYTSFAEGPLKATGNQYDLAIKGKGFFEVLSPQGPRLTRNGIFRVSPAGQLVTKEGYPVLRDGVGQPPEGRVIQLTGEAVTVSPQGELLSGNQILARLSVVRPTSNEDLVKQGHSLFAFKPNALGGPLPANDFEIHQGFVEGSNINVVQEMTDMISATRAFEATQKTMTAFDKMNEKLVTEVPRTS